MLLCLVELRSHPFATIPSIGRTHVSSSLLFVFSSRRLNTDSNHAVYNHVNLNAYTSTGDADQIWYENPRSNGSFIIVSTLDSSYGINRLRSSNNCDLYPWENNLADATVLFEGPSIRLAAPANGVYYYLKIDSSSRYNAYWSTSSSESWSESSV